MKIELFELDPETRMININKVWISTILEFKTLLKRDKGSKGDADGRVKAQAIREFTFIYHFCDFKSKFREIAEEDKLKECLRNADLPTDLNIYEDEDLLKAIARYKAFQDIASLRLLNELKEGLHTAYRVVRKLREALDKKLDTIEFVEITDEEIDPKKRKKSPVAYITELLTSLIAIQNSIPDTLEQIEKLEEKVKKELGDDNSVRGGHEKGIKEDKQIKAKVVETNMFSDL